MSRFLPLGEDEIVILEVFNAILRPCDSPPPPLFHYLHQKRGVVASSDITRVVLKEFPVEIKSHLTILFQKSRIEVLI
jgi:hypothetical protein